MEVGDDDTFLVAAFSVVASLLFCIYLPTMLRLLSAKGRAELRGSCAQTAAEVRAVLGLLWQPRILFAGAAVLAREPRIAREHVLPAATRWLRPRYILLIAFCVLLPIVAEQKLLFDPYATLGVPPDASEKAVKKAYRKLALQLHPDKNPEPDAKYRYARIRKAYQALTSPEKWEEDMRKEPGSVVVALPTFLTDEKHRGPAMLVMLLCLLCPPIWFLMKLAKPKAVPGVKEGRALVRYNEQAERLFAALGRPERAEDRLLAAARRGLLRELNEAGDIFGDPENVVDPLPFGASDVVAFHPGVLCAAEFRQLCLQAGQVPKKGQAGTAQQKEIAEAQKRLAEELWVHKDATGSLGEMQRAVSDKDFAEKHRGVDPDALRRIVDRRRSAPEARQEGDAPYRPPSAAQCKAAQSIMELIVTAVKQQKESLAESLDGAKRKKSAVAGMPAELAQLMAQRVCHLLDARNHHLQGREAERDAALADAVRCELKQQKLLHRYPQEVIASLRQLMKEIKAAYSRMQAQGVDFD